MGAVCALDFGATMTVYLILWLSGHAYLNNLLESFLF